MKAGATAAVDRVWCTELELGCLELDAENPGELRAVSTDRFDVVRVLFRLHGEPVQFVSCPLEAGRISITELLAGLCADGRRRVEAHLEFDSEFDSAETSADAIPAHCPRPPAAVKTISVVVCTRNRGPVLRGCLERLRRLDYAGVDFVIVDNAPTDAASHDVFMAVVGADPRFRYVVEPRPGLSCARNRGLAEAGGEFIVYTDDDVRVDAGWIRAIVGGFARPGSSEVACVTGLVCTAMLNTAAEHYFDGKVSWSARCDAKLYDLRTTGVDLLYPYAAGLFGTGASMGFRTSTLRELGGFDEALGAGSRTAGGEDLDIFVRVIQAGYALAYEPAALAWHHHRSDVDGLYRQMFGYGSGLTAYITKHLIDRRSRRDLIGRIPRGVVRLATMSRDSQTTVKSGALPTRGLLARELGGMAMGPFLYVIARRNPPAKTELVAAEV